MSKKQKNVDIYQHTIEYCKKAGFPVFVSLKHSYYDPQFSDEKILSLMEPNNQPAQILVENIDSFDLAIKMDDGFNKIMVLNLASPNKPGGGVGNGSRAQEEDLYRKSNYFEANYSGFYPLKMNEVIYSPLVHIIKDSSYKLLNEPYKVSCLAVAAIRNPKLKILPNKSQTYLNEKDAQIMQEKIDMIFKVGIKHGHKQLVLGALGCGVFNNPVREVAMMFKKSLNKYSNYFTKIGFAIMSDYGNPNFNIFKEVIHDQDK